MKKKITIGIALSPLRQNFAASKTALAYVKKTIKTGIYSSTPKKSFTNPTKSAI